MLLLWGFVMIFCLMLMMVWMSIWRLTLIVFRIAKSFISTSWIFVIVCVMVRVCLMMMWKMKMMMMIS